MKGGHKTEGGGDKGSLYTQSGARPLRFHPRLTRSSIQHPREGQNEKNADISGDIQVYVAGRKQSREGILHGTSSFFCHDKTL